MAIWGDNTKGERITAVFEESNSGLLKIGISKKKPDFTGTKFWEYADFNKDEKAYRALLCLQFQACFVVFTVVRLPRLVAMY